VEGEGKLIGLDNGDPLSHEDYKAARRKAFHGMCLAIVQSTGKSGRIRITANSPGLQSGSLTISTRT
jgi:beta-galactosidase